MNLMNITKDNDFINNLFFLRGEVFLMELSLCQSVYFSFKAVNWLLEFFAVSNENR